jgi:PEP-CTERM motif
MRFSRPLALGLLLVLGTIARAEPIWSYSWSSSPGVVTSDDGSLGKVTLTPASGGPFTGSVNSGPGILAATLDATGPASGAAVFTNQGYGLTMHLTDNASHTSADLNFSGAFSGTLGSTFALTNSFKSPLTESVTLGGNLYNVTVGLYVPPQPGKAGSLGANVSVTGSGQPPPVVHSVPEPTSLVLAGLGLSALGLRCWRRLRARA